MQHCRPTSLSTGVAWHRRLCRSPSSAGRRPCRHIGHLFYTSCNSWYRGSFGGQRWPTRENWSPSWPPSQHEPVAKWHYSCTAYSRDIVKGQTTNSTTNQTTEVAPLNNCHFYVIILYTKTLCNIQYEEACSRRQKLTTILVYIFYSFI